MNVNTHANGTLAPAADGDDSLGAALRVLWRSHVASPVRAWRDRNRALDLIASMDQRDLDDLGYSRHELRRAVLTNADLRG